MGCCRGPLRTGHRSSRLCAELVHPLDGGLELVTGPRVSGNDCPARRRGNDRRTHSSNCAGIDPGRVLRVTCPPCGSVERHYRSLCLHRCPPTAPAPRPARSIHRPHPTPHPPGPPTHTVPDPESTKTTAPAHRSRAPFETDAQAYARRTSEAIGRSSHSHVSSCSIRMGTGSNLATSGQRRGAPLGYEVNPGSPRTRKPSRPAASVPVGNSALKLPQNIGLPI